MGPRIDTEVDGGFACTRVCVSFRSVVQQVRLESRALPLLSIRKYGARSAIVSATV